MTVLAFIGGLLLGLFAAAFMIARPATSSHRRLDWTCPKCGHPSGPDCRDHGRTGPNLTHGTGVNYHQRYQTKFDDKAGLIYTMCCDCKATITQKPLDAPHVEAVGAVSEVPPNA